MKTDDLIADLAGRLEPTSSMALMRRAGLWLGGAVVVSALMMLLVLGPNSKFAMLACAPSFWIKFAYTLAVGAAAFWAAERLGRPGAPAVVPGVLVAVVLGGFGAIASTKLMMAPAPMRHHMLMGHSALFCPWLILALSVPLLIGAVMTLRGFAPTRPGLAGLAGGLGAGAVAAFVYGFACDETAMPFIAVWYTLPILIAGAVGALIGRFALRW